MHDSSQSEIEKLLAVWDDSIRVQDYKPAEGGLYNNVYFLKTSRGRLVLRIAPPDDIPKLFYEKNMMHSEPYLHSLVRNNTSVPAPEILFHDFSRHVIDRDYLFMEFIVGNHGIASPYELGALVRQIHSIQGPKFGYPNRNLAVFSSWRETFLIYVRMILSNCLSAGAFDCSTYSRFLETFYRHESAFSEILPSLLHLDLWSANILSLNGTIRAILDFDRSMFGDPELEFAVLDTYGLGTEEFFAGYGKSRPKGNAAEIRRRLYTFYELVKYSFIRLARGGSPSAAQYHLDQCEDLLRDL